MEVVKKIKLTEDEFIKNVAQVVTDSLILESTLNNLERTTLIKDIKKRLGWRYKTLYKTCACLDIPIEKGGCLCQKEHV